MVRPTQLTALIGGIAVTFICACEVNPENEPDFEWQGDQIDIVGYGTEPADTCAGTFSYLDAFAGATATEFGVAGHMGVYRWYSPELFEVDHPCMTGATGCAGSNGVFSRLMPSEHEVVHLVAHHLVACPSIISEGLAEYYGMTSKTPTSTDVTPLISQSEQGTIESDGYPLAGAFVAYLVDTFGLNAVMNSCEITGPYPSVESFSTAAQQAFAVPFDQVLLDFAETNCTYAEYRAKHFECGGDPDLVVDDAPSQINLEIDCNSVSTIGPRTDEIWTLSLVRVLQSGTYLAEVMVLTGDYNGVRVELNQCVGCSDSPRTHQLVAEDASIVTPIQLDASDYFMQVYAPMDAKVEISLRLTLL